MKLKLLALTMFLAVAGLSTHAQNTVQKVGQVAGTVTLTDAVDYTITSSETPFATMATIDIQNPDAAIVFENIRPSTVIDKYLSKITYNGTALKHNDNCLVSIYRHGAIVFAHSDNKNADGSPFYPVTMFSDDNFTDTISGYNGTSRYTSGAWKDKARSFILKRGYMCTVANDAAGTGYSHCYIANSADRKITLRRELAGKLGFFRIFRWQWPTKLGMSDARSEAIRFGTNASWYYDWGAGRSSLTDAEYVPQRHHEAGQSNGDGYKGAWESWANINASDNTCTHILGQNEPDNTSGGKEVYTYVTSIPSNPREKHGDYPLVNVAKDFLYSGKRIGTFACCNPNTGWVSEYINWCRNNNVRVDFVATHYYIGGTTPQGCIDRLWALYNATGLPVWVTEWNNGANWTTEPGFSTDSEGWYEWGSGNDQHKNGVWLKDVLVRADKPENKWLERLAVYNAVEWKRQIEADGQLTDAGKVLGTYHSGFAYNDDNEYFMPWNHKSPNDLTQSYNASSKIVKLTWTHNNSKQTDSICVQRKVEGETFVTIKNLGMREGGTITYNDTVQDISGLVIYKICDYDTDNKLRYTNEVNVTVAPAQGTNEIQFGKQVIDGFKENTIRYSEPFDAAPCVFIGTLTNKNTQVKAGNNTGKTNNASIFTYQPLAWNSSKSEMNNTEEVPFLALKDGNYTYGDMACEVAVAKSGTATGEDNWTDVTEVTFKQPFPEGVTPVVLTEIRKPGYTSGTNSSSLTCRIFDVTNTGFKFIIYSEYSSNRKVGLAQNVCYLAITPGMGYADEEAGIIIAAGHGNDSQIYASSQKENNFTIASVDDEGKPTTEQLYLYSPTVLTQLQTNNTPSVTMLRRTDSTKKDESGNTWVTGTKVNRVLDRTSFTIVGEDGKSTTVPAGDMNNAAIRDNLGWVTISKVKEGGSAPVSTAIKATPADGSSTLSARVVDRRIIVDGVSSFEVYSIAGTKVEAKASLEPGIYVVKANGKSTKVLVR